MNITQVNWEPTNLSNEVIKLVPLAITDFDRLYQIASDPLIWEQHPSKERYKKEVFQDYFDGAIQGRSAFLIIDNATDELIGCTRYYDYDGAHSSVAIGFTFLVRACWGGHFNKYCKRLLLDYAFRFVDKVYLHIGANNIRSQLGTVRFRAKKVREFKVEGNDQLTYEYVIKKEDWIKNG